MLLLWLLLVVGDVGIGVGVGGVVVVGDGVFVVVSVSGALFFVVVVDLVAVFVVLPPTHPPTHPPIHPPIHPPCNATAPLGGPKVHLEPENEGQEQRLVKPRGGAQAAAVTWALPEEEGRAEGVGNAGIGKRRRGPVCDTVAWPWRAPGTGSG